MLIFAWRASSRRTWPTSSPWNSRTPTPPLSVSASAPASGAGAPAAGTDAGAVLLTAPAGVPAGFVIGGCACTSVIAELSPGLAGAAGADAGLVWEVGAEGLV